MGVAWGWRFSTEIVRCVWQDWQTDERSNTFIVTMGSSSDVDSSGDGDGLSRQEFPGDLGTLIRLAQHRGPRLDKNVEPRQLR